MKAELFKTAPASLSEAGAGMRHGIVIRYLFSSRSGR